MVQIIHDLDNLTTTNAQSETSELNDIQAIQQNVEDISHVDGEFDFLHDIEEDKEIYRLKVLFFYHFSAQQSTQMPVIWDHNFHSLDQGHFFLVD